MKHYFVVEIDSDSKPGALGTMLCRELYLQCGGQRTKVWEVDSLTLRQVIDLLIDGTAPIPYDPIIDDGHAPDNYIPDRQDA